MHINFELRKRYTGVWEIVLRPLLLYIKLSIIAII